MATIKKRINISVSKDIERALTRLALRDAVPQATKATHLLVQAIELEEDVVWDALARKREQNGGRYLSHREAWSK